MKGLNFLQESPHRNCSKFDIMVGYDEDEYEDEYDDEYDDEYEERV